MGEITWSQRLRYLFDDIMARGTIALIGALAVLSVILIAAVSAVVAILGVAPELEGQPVGFFKVAWMSLMRTLDAGTMGGDEGHWGFLLAMFVVTMGGVFIVSSLIGVLSSGLDRALEEMRKGRSRVLERDHTVLLGWSPQVFQIIEELVVANANRKGAALVILADRDKVEMEDNIRARVNHRRSTRVICRSGSPMDVTDLEIVSPQTARSIIVVPDDGDDPDTNVIKCVLAITNSPHRRRTPYHIVVAVRDPRNLAIVNMIGRDEVEPVLVGQLIARVITQTSRQSGLSTVYTELLNFEGDEIYFHAEPRLVGTTYGQALLAYKDSTLLGLRSRDGRVELNPPMDTVIQPGDQVIAISADDDTVRLSGLAEPPVLLDALCCEGERRQLQPERVLVLGWNGNACQIIRELDHYVVPGSEATVVNDALDEAVQADCAAAGLRNLHVTWQTGSTTDRATLDGLSIPAYGQVIVLSCTEQLDAEEADARTLMTLLHLRDIADRSGHAFSIVSEMLDLRNRQLAEATRADDFIVSGQLVGLLVAQLSENKALGRVFEELFDPGGAEIYMKPIGEYVEVGRPVNFFTVVEAARRRGETALGYRLVARAGDPGSAYGVRVNPAKSETVTFEAGDRAIVLANS